MCLYQQVVEEYPVLDEADEGTASQSVPVELLLSQPTEVTLSYDSPEESPQHDVIVIVTDSESEDEQEDDEEEEPVWTEGNIVDGNILGARHFN